MDGLGINWQLLVAEIINFAILLLILKRFLYKPFLRLLEQRRAKIEEGVTKADEAEKSLQKIRALSDEIRQKDERRSKEIIQNAEKKAQERTKAILAAAEEDKGKLLARAKSAIEREKAAAAAEQRRNSIEMAFALAEKVIKEKMDKAQDRKLIEKLAEDIK